MIGRQPFRGLVYPLPPDAGPQASRYRPGLSLRVCGASACYLLPDANPFLSLRLLLNRQNSALCGAQSLRAEVPPRADGITQFGGRWISSQFCRERL
jgi:hypothetical protein